MQKLKHAKRSKQKKQSTIEGIAPTWARLLPLIDKTDQQEFYNGHSRLDISDAKWCIVGEAYGFSDKYFDVNDKEFCRDCFSHSVNFASVLQRNPENRKNQVNSFVEHWNFKHM